MKEELRLHFERAEECLDDSDLLLENHRFSSSVGRSYYAMFHAATAILLTKDIIRSSHQGIISAFGQHFAKTSRIDQKYHKYFVDAFERRQESDYQPVANINQKTAEKISSRAKEFVQACRQLCQLK